jgi:hypothetical protein
VLVPAVVATAIFGIQAFASPPEDDDIDDDGPS